MILADVTKLIIPEGEVVKITHGDTVLWPYMVCDPQVTLYILSTIPNSYWRFSITIKGISPELITEVMLCGEMAYADPLNLSSIQKGDTVNGYTFTKDVDYVEVANDGSRYFWIQLKYKDLAGVERYKTSERVYI